MSRPRKIDGYERAKRAEYRGQPHTQQIAVGYNRDSLLEIASQLVEAKAKAKAKAEDDAINDAIIEAVFKGVDLKINQELRELIHRY